MAASRRFTIGLAAAWLLCTSASAFADASVLLTDRQLDQVTAGLALGGSTAALAKGGTIAITETDGGTIGTTTALPNGGFIESGVIAGTASADAPGGSTATGAASAGTVDGNTLLTTGIHATVAGAGAQISIGFTYVSGGTTVIP